MNKSSVLISSVLLCSTAVSAPPSSLYSLAWEENFNSGQVDTSRWNYRTDVKALSAQLPANAVVTNGQLSLLTKQENVSGKSYTGGGLVSKQSFGYGYFEVTARTSNNLGWHNSFWMMRGDGSNTLGPGRYLEIDSFEIDTQEPSKVRAARHAWTGEPGNPPHNVLHCPLPSPAFDSSAQFHTYGVNWYEGGLDYYIDGVKYCTLAYSATQYRQDPVNIWLTAIAYTAPVTVGGTPQLYDNVRYYKRNQYVYNGEYGYSESGAGWANSSLAGFGLMPQRYTCSAGASSRYAPYFRQAGNYRVYIWKTAHSNADAAATVTIASTSTTAKTINFASGSSGWVDLGVYYFDTGTSGSVTNLLNGGCQRAGAVKFVRE